MEKITGQDLIDAGATPGKWFAEALEAANAIMKKGSSREIALAFAMTYEPVVIPVMSLQNPDDAPINWNMNSVTTDEIINSQSVEATIKELMKTPVVKEVSIMPDACPAGPVGTIPVGGIVVSEHIHPGMHSADVCCSVMMSEYSEISPKELLDAVHAVTHFGPGGRPRGKQWAIPKALIENFSENQFLKGLESNARDHFGTQGDGNHFAFVGNLKSSGNATLVTHHGSRGLGAAVYKRGMQVAERYRKEISPDTLPVNAWIPRGTDDFNDYMEALNVVSTWTYLNHKAIHDAAIEYHEKMNEDSIAVERDRIWNPHNFVFEKPGTNDIYHAKGATPVFQYDPFNFDDSRLIPLSMNQPVLIVRNHPENEFGFAPHGAGRNLSRTKYKAKHSEKTVEEIYAEETKGIDARFFSGKIDISELPSAYKDAAKIHEEIEKFNLAEIIDEVIPYGCIMAGENSWSRK